MRQNRFFVLQACQLSSVALLLASCLLGQGASGSITGTLKDSSGAVVPNSSVVAHSVESGRQYQTKTNETGIYNLAALPPGHYALTVEVPGFKRLVTNPIEIEVNQIARIDLTLEVGAAAEAWRCRTTCWNPYDRCARTRTASRAARWCRISVWY